MIFKVIERPGDRWYLFVGFERPKLFGFMEREPIWWQVVESGYSDGVIATPPTKCSYNLGYVRKTDVSGFYLYSIDNTEYPKKSREEVISLMSRYKEDIINADVDTIYNTTIISEEIL